MDVGEDGLTVFTDNACCGSSSSLRSTIVDACGIPDRLIQTKSNCLHSILRLTRSCNLRSVRYGSFSRSLKQASFVSPKGDLEILRSQTAKEAGVDGNKDANIPPTSKSALRRFVPNAEMLWRRLERVVNCYVALDEEAAQCHDANNGSVTFLTENFWMKYTSLLRHIDSSCANDDPSSQVYIKDASGAYRCRRSTSHCESRHSVIRRSMASLTRCGPALWDARLFWDVTMAHRRTTGGGSQQLGGSPPPRCWARPSLPSLSFSRS